MARANSPKLPNEREAIILQILLRGEKYGLEIRQEYEKQANRRMPIGALYTTLDRMEEHGFVAPRVGEETHERGGNRRKYFRLTAVGASALDDYRTLLKRSRSIFGLSKRVDEQGGALQ